MTIRWSTPQEAEAVLLATMRFCDAMTYDGSHPLSCCEEPNHTGPHRYGWWAWNDEARIQRIQDALRSGT